MSVKFDESFRRVLESNSNMPGFTSRARAVFNCICCCAVVVWRGEVADLEIL